VSARDENAGRQGIAAPSAAPGPRLAVAAALPRLGAALARNLVAERERWILWAPVAFAAGIGLYFSLAVEPPLWPWIAAGALVLGLRAALARPVAGAAGDTAAVLRFCAAGIALILVGGAVATLRAQSVAAPVLSETVGPTRITGRVFRVEDLPEGQRLVLDRLRIPGLGREATPERVRVRLRTRDDGLLVGERVALTAILGPPPAPSAPAAFDFQRQAYFSRLGAVGFALGKAGAVEAGTGDGGTADDLGRAGAGASAFNLWLSGVRQTITARVRAALPGAKGAVAAALMTGDQGAIPADVLSAMRNSGLAHLLAVSGLNFVLVAGTVFFAVRGLLALVPPLALRFPIKKWAAVAALLSAAGYFGVTDQSAPTERAFIMAALLFLAVLVDRTAISMRTTAWAALAILAVEPESLLGASFQLSFAAVVALVAAFEMWQERRVSGDERDGLPHDEGGGAEIPLAPVDATSHGLRRDLRRIAWRARRGPRERAWWNPGLLYLGGIIGTTIVTSVATAPFLVYHFGRFTNYGLAANLVAIPVTGAWIMPWAVAAFALMPFGLEKLALVPMGWGVGLVNEVARAVGSWPGAVIAVPAIPLAAVAVMSLGGLWLCLWRRPWRFGGLALMALGGLAVLFSRSPDILVDGDAKLMGVRAADGGLVLSSLSAARFEGQAWVRRFGEDAATRFPGAGATADGSLSCDARGCLYRARGRVVALARDESALAEDCGFADLVVSLVPAQRICRQVSVIDRFDLWRNGTYAVWLEARGVRIESVRGWQGRRPWVPVRARRHKDRERPAEDPRPGD
jgi:competence protein ComEC